MGALGGMPRPQAAAANGEAMAENRCGPAPGKGLRLDLSGIDASPSIERALEGMVYGPACLRRLADKIERQEAERDAKARAEVEARERDADRLLVVEEMGRAAGLGLKGWVHADLVTLATGHGPEDRLTTSVKNQWWRMLVAASRELRRLRAALMAAKPKPSIVIGRYTLDRLSKGLAVDLVAEGSAIYPASDFPAEAIRRALEPDVDALAKRIDVVIQTEDHHALTRFGRPSSAAYARRIAEELCR